MAGKPLKELVVFLGAFATGALIICTFIYFLKR